MHVEHGKTKRNKNDYHLNIFVNMVTPIDIITAPFTLGERFFTKAQTISTTSILQLKPETCNLMAEENYSYKMKDYPITSKSMKFNDIPHIFLLAPYACFSITEGIPSIHNRVTNSLTSTVYNCSYP